MKKFWNFAKTEDAATLNIYGPIVSSATHFDEKECVCTLPGFLSDMQKVPNDIPLNVFINSQGGEVFTAFAIYSHLKRHNGPVNTYVDGIAASAATIIAMAGERRYMDINSLFMIHLPSTRVQGNRVQIEKDVNTLNKIENILLDIYCDKCNMTREILSKMLEDETWLNVDEAIDCGFITDKIISEENSGILMDDFALDIAMYSDIDKVQQKIKELKNKNISKGGTDIMDFGTFFNELSEDMQAMVQAEIDNRLASKDEEIQNLRAELENIQKPEEKPDEKSAEQPGEQSEESKKEEQTQNVIDIKNELSPEASIYFDRLQKENDSIKNQLLELLEQRAFEDFSKRLEVFNNLPMQENHIRILYKVFKNSKEDFEVIEPLLKVANESLKVSFSQIGQDHPVENGPVDAYSEISDKVNDYMNKNDGISYNEAFKAVIAENPDLYYNYCNQK